MKFDLRLADQLFALIRRVSLVVVFIRYPDLIFLV